MRRDLSKEPFTKAERVEMFQSLREIVAQAVYMAERLENGGNISGKDLGYIYKEYNIVCNIVEPAPILTDESVNALWSAFNEIDFGSIK